MTCLLLYITKQFLQWEKENNVWVETDGWWASKNKFLIGSIFIQISFDEFQTKANNHIKNVKNSFDFKRLTWKLLNEGKIRTLEKALSRPKVNNSDVSA